jgi:hypothetical protein
MSARTVVVIVRTTTRPRHLTVGMSSTTTVPRYSGRRLNTPRSRKRRRSPGEAVPATRYPVVCTAPVSRRSRRSATRSRSRSADHGKIVRVLARHAGVAMRKIACAVHARGGLWTPTGRGQPRAPWARARMLGRWLPSALGQPRVRTRAEPGRGCPPRPQAPPPGFFFLVVKRSCPRKLGVARHHIATARRRPGLVPFRSIRAAGTSSQTGHECSRSHKRPCGDFVPMPQSGEGMAKTGKDVFLDDSA